MLVLNYRVILVAVIILFAGIQLYFWHTHSIWSDESLYAWYAQQLHHDLGYLYSAQLWEYHPPLFSLLASLLVNFFDPLLSIRLLSIIFGLLTIILIYLIGKKIENEKLGVICAVVLAYHSAFLTLSNKGLLDTAFCFGIALTTLGLMQFLENRKWKVFALGIVFSILTKRFGFISILLALLSVVFAHYFHSRSQKKSFWSEAPVRTIGILAIILFLSVIFAFQFSVPRDFIYSTNPIDALSKNTIALGTLIGLGLFVFIFLGIHPLARSKGQKWIIAAWVASFVIVLFYPITDSRFWFPVLLPLIIIAGMGIKRIGDSPGRFPIELAVVLTLVVAPSLVSGVNSISMKSFDGYRETSRWITAHTTVEPIYAPSVREFRYYTGIETEKYGGRLAEYPSSKEEFEKTIQNYPKVYVLKSIYPNPFVDDYFTSDFLSKNDLVKVDSINSDENRTSLFTIYVRNESK